MTPHPVSPTVTHYGSPLTLVADGNLTGSGAGRLGSSDPVFFCIMARKRAAWKSKNGGLHDPIHSPY